MIRSLNKSKLLSIVNLEFYFFRPNKEHDVTPTQALDTPHTPAYSCLCCDPNNLSTGHSRRGFLGLGAAALTGGLLAMSPSKSHAASGN